MLADLDKLFSFTGQENQSGNVVLDCYTPRNQVRGGILE